MTFAIQRVHTETAHLMDGLLSVFASAFEDSESYLESKPSVEYLRRLLGGESFIALVALLDDVVVGALAAYELKKFEQERSEVYIYDLAVDAAQRRKGIATALITELKTVARQLGAYVIYVQADLAEEDEPARALYSKLGTREDVLHFDIDVDEAT